jgi:hypothetical protein
VILAAPGFSYESVARESTFFRRENAPYGEDEIKRGTDSQIHRMHNLPRKQSNLLRPIEVTDRVLNAKQIQSDAGTGECQTTAT